MVQTSSRSDRLHLLAFEFIFGSFDLLTWLEFIECRTRRIKVRVCFGRISEKNLLKFLKISTVHSRIRNDRLNEFVDTQIVKMERNIV